MRENNCPSGRVGVHKNFLFVNNTQFSYRHSANRIASVIENSPYSGRENFLRNIDFLIKFGPLPSMRIPAHNQSIVEHYMIDVHALVTGIFLILGFLIFVFSRFVLNRIVRVVSPVN